MPVAARRNPAELIAALQRATESVLRPLLSAEKPIALLDYPAYANVGDSAIWLGELRWLRVLTGHAPRYTCDLHTFDAAELRRRVGRSTILLSGGGNFGDLYEQHQHFREMVIATFPHNRIVQLAQTIQFRSSAALAQAGRVFDQHPDLTILVRDRRSLEIAANCFRARVALCPDMAFGLGPLPRMRAPTRPVLHLLRSDDESGSASRDSVETVDWPDAEPSTIMAALQRTLRRRLRGVGGSSWLARTYAPLARQRLERGCRLLQSAERVVTDRLHGHILCLLLGIPHKLLADRYGKVRDFHDTWTADCALVEGAEVV